MPHRILTCILLAGALATASAEDRPATSDAALVRTVTALANEMAANASRRDVKANAHLIPDTDRVVYVSKGVPVSGKEYVEGLGEFYARHRSLSHVWTKMEITPIGPDAAAFTGWATLTAETLAGEKQVERAIFTAVFARTPDGWKRVLAQKAILRED